MYIYIYYLSSFNGRILTYEGFPGTSDGKESTCNAEDMDSIPGTGKSPAEGNGYPLQYSCLENSMDRGVLVGYSPWDHKESDMTEQLTHTLTHTHTHIHIHCLTNKVKNYQAGSDQSWIDSGKS